MDSFAEQLIVRRKTTTDILLTVLIILGAAALIFCVVYFLFFLLAIAFLLIVGIGWLAWFALTRLNVEYEYTVTNGDIDIDKIVARSKRTRLVSVPHDRIESLFPYSEAALQGRRFDRVVEVASAKENSTWCFTYHSKKSGHTLVTFEPDERVFRELYDGLPKLMQIEVDRAKEA